MAWHDQTRCYVAIIMVVYKAVNKSCVPWFPRGCVDHTTDEIVPYIYIYICIYIYMYMYMYMYVYMYRYNTKKQYIHIYIYVYIYICTHRNM